MPGASVVGWQVKLLLTTPTFLIRVPIQALTIPFPIQLLDHAARKVVEEGPSAWTMPPGGRPGPAPAVAI